MSELQRVEAEISAIYRRSCNGPGDRQRLPVLQAQQRQLEAARRTARAKSPQHDSRWEYTPGQRRGARR